MNQKYFDTQNQRLSPRLDKFYEEIGVKTLDLLYPNCLPIASSKIDFTRCLILECRMNPP